MVDLATSLSRVPTIKDKLVTITPSLVLRALMTTRIRLVILLAVCITAAGLLIPQPASAAAPAAAPAAPAAALLDPECESDPTLCTPPPMLNKQLLQDPSSIYRATAAQQAAIAALEAEAVVNALADHRLPTSDADAMRSWGREAVQAQLWALMTKAIRTDAGSRSADQAQVVAWLQQLMNRKAKETALNAGWEYLQWAGRVASSEPRPPEADILSALQGFASGALQPVNYMFGTADNSDSGYCDYLPPAGYEAQYDGNASRPLSRAGAWCFPPYQCGDPLGCDNRQPALQSFLNWGEADVALDGQANEGFVATAKTVGEELVFAGAAAGTGTPDVAMRVGLGAGIAGATMANVAVVLAQAVIMDLGVKAAAGNFLLLSKAALGQLAVASSVAAVVAVVVVAIAIAVFKGIDVAQDAALPGQLRDLVTNALSGEQDVQAMLTDQSDLTALFSIFVRATGPTPKSETCDNSQFVIGGPLVAPCANRTPVPAASVDEMQFRIQTLSEELQPVGAPVRSDSLTWIDSATSRTFINSGYWTNHARLSDSWLVASTTLPDGTNSGEYLTHTLSGISSQQIQGYANPPFVGMSSWLRRQPGGGYKFLNAIHSVDTLTTANEPVDPATCTGFGLCSLTDTVRLYQPPAEPGGRPVPIAVSIVPALKAGITLSHSANPQVGEPVTLTATETGPDVGPLTYEWYVQPASGLIPVCGPTVRFCGYDGPFTGSEIEYTWQGSGTFKAASVVTTEQGRETVTEMNVVVDSTGPVLSIGDFGETPFTSPYEPFGHIVHAGATDVLTLTIDWGDGSEDTRSTYTPGQGSICATPPCPVFTVTSANRLDFTLKHSYADPGSYEVTATVQDGAGRLDRRIFNHQVDKGQQAISFARPFDVRSIGEPPYETYADGGGAQTPVVVASTSPNVCHVSDPSSSRVDGHARTTFTVTLVGMGFCALTADQAGDDRYVAASQVLGFVEVVGLTQTLDFAALGDRTFGDDPFEVSATGGSSTAPVELDSTTPAVCTVSDLTPGRDSEDRETATATVTLLRAGSCTIKATQAGDVGYTSAEPVQRTFEVAKAAQAIDFAPLVDRTLGDALFLVSAIGGRSSSDLVLSSSTPGVCTLSAPTSTRVDGRARGSATVTLVAVGTCTIVAQQDGDDNYLAAEPVSRSFAVQQKVVQTLDFPAIAGRTFGDAPFEVTVIGGGSSAPVVLTSTRPEVCGISGATSSRVDGLERTTATVTLLAAGTCGINASQAGDAGHLDASPVDRFFLVERAAQTLSFSAIESATYGDAPIPVTVTGGRSTAPVVVSSTTTSVCTVSGATSSRVDGMARTQVSVTLLAAGTCTLLATQAGDANTLAAAETTQSFEIGRAFQPMTFPDIADRTFGSAPFTITVTGGPAAGQVALVSLTSSVCTLSGATSTRVGGLARTTATVTIIAAGPCVIAAGQAGDANRWPGAALRAFTVAKAPLTITAVDKTMTWRGTVPAYTVTFAGFVNGNDASVVSGLACTATNSAGVVASSTSPVGLYAITCSGATAANYAITYVPGVLRIVYAFTGFQGLSSTNVNSLRAGSTLSLKWVLKDANGALVSTSSSFESVKAAPMTCGGAIPTGGTNVGPGVAGLSYTPNGTWTYNWQTPSNLAGTCQAVTLRLADGSARTIRLRLTT